VASAIPHGQRPVDTEAIQLGNEFVSYPIQVRRVSLEANMYLGGLLPTSVGLNQIVPMSEATLRPLPFDKPFDQISQYLNGIRIPCVISQYVYVVF